MSDELSGIDLSIGRRRAAWMVLDYSRADLSAAGAPLATSSGFDREWVDLRATSGGDLATATGLANLTQAIVARLLTRRGELAVFGHAEYGSRLHLLIGEPNNTRTRLLAEIYLREALAQDGRVAEVVSVEAAPPERGIDRDTLKLTVAVRPAGREELLRLGLALNLAG